VNGPARAALPAPLAARWGAWRARWRALAARDRRLVGLALALIGVLLLWTVAVQPAWRTLRTAPAQLERLELQLHEMQALAAEVQELRAAPALGGEQSAAALKAASDRLGDKARLSLQGERAMLTLNGVSATQLREWLNEARAGARARPVEARLARSVQGFTGTIVLTIGAGP
jgi:general secretion pathway protein M